MNFVVAVFLGRSIFGSWDVTFCHGRLRFRSKLEFTNLLRTYVTLHLSTAYVRVPTFNAYNIRILPISRSHFANKTSFFGTLGSTRAQGSRYNVAVLRRILEKNSLMFFFFFLILVGSNNNEKSILYLSATTHFI